MKIAVVGLGLIGGSFAKAIRTKTDHFVMGYDRSEDVLQQAQSEGAIEETVTEDFSAADLILVALYPEQTVEFIYQHLPTFRQGAVVVDLCGVKRYICDQVEPMLQEAGVVFIGGHPMAGRELSGYANALSTLFDGASMILTPSSLTPKPVLQDISDFFRSIGFGHIETTTPARHDQMIAYTSQLAHIVSSAYIRCPEAMDYQGFSAGSFKDLTRVARLNEEMWSELFLLNGDYLTEKIDDIIEILCEYRDCIGAQDSATLQQILREGRQRKELLSQGGTD